MRWDLIRLAGGIVLAGAAFAVLDQVASRSRNKSRAQSSSGGLGGSDSPFVGAAATPRSYFELMQVRAKRKQDRQTKGFAQTQANKTERWDLLAEREKRAESLRREAERLSATAERREGRTAERVERTEMREADLEAYGGTPEYDTHELYAAAPTEGFVRIGKLDERGEIRAAKALESATEKQRRAAGQVKVAARHDLASARASKKAGTGTRGDVRTARRQLQGAREQLRTARYGELAAEQELRKERAEGRAAARQRRAEEVEASVEQSLTDFRSTYTPEAALYAPDVKLSAPMTEDLYEGGA